jgi:hypothetical protein
MGENADVVIAKIRWVGEAQRLLLVIVALVAASPAALADSASLICDEKGTAGVYTYDGAVTVDLNETQHSVVVHYPGVTGTVPVFHREARSVGPLLAIFKSDSITFSIPGNVITINRMTGEAVIRTDGGQTMAESWNCRAGKKQF